MPAQTHSPADVITARAAQVTVAEQTASTAWEEVANAARAIAAATRDTTEPSTKTLRTRLDRQAQAAHRASADFDHARRLLATAITRRDNDAARAGTGLLRPREIGRALETHLNANRIAGLQTYFSIATSEARGQRTITVTWVGMPTLTDGQAMLADALTHVTDGTNQQIDLRCERRRFWACGNLHTNAEDAFCDHEASEEGLGTRWSHRDGHDVLDYEAEAELAEQGREAVSRCVEGEFEKCPACWGQGTSDAYRDALRRRGAAFPKYDPCTACQGRRILDLDDPADRTIYETETPKAVALAAKVKAAEERKAATRRTR